MPAAETTRVCVHNQRRNPLAVDPTHTTTIRRRFEADLRRRFGNVKRGIQDFLVTKDALGLKPRKSFITMVQPREFEFATDESKLTAFNVWLLQEIQSQNLSVPGGSALHPVTADYIESAFKRGQLNAYLSSKDSLIAEQAGIGEQSQESFLRSAFAAPESMSKVRMLATRSFEQLKGVSSTMASDMNRILAQGMIEGRGPAALAKQMADRIDGLTNSRAMVIARTEIIRAHAEGQLDSFEKLGVEELGIKAEWSTAGDDRVCEQCAGMEGQVYTVKEAHGLIPLHPQCRCAWIPFDESIEGKKGATVQEPVVVSPAREEWQPSMDAERAALFTKGSYFEGQELYHFTKAENAIGIAKEGFRLSDGNYGKGIYLTRDPEGSTIGRSFNDARLEVAVRAESVLEVKGFSGLSRWMDENAPGNYEVAEALALKGKDALVVKFTGKPDFIVLFDKKTVSVIGKQK